MEKIHTIKELNERVWYRFIKVIYILFFVLILSGVLIEIFEEVGKITYLFAILQSLLGISVIILVFELIKRIFYYIVLGKINPNKE